LSKRYQVKIYPGNKEANKPTFSADHQEVYMAEAGHGYGLSRRGFVAGMVALLGTIIGAIIGLPAVGYLLSPALKKSQTESDTWVPLGLVDELPVDEPTLFTFTRTKQIGWERSANSYGIYVLKKPDGQIETVSWHEDQGQYVCPCHDGRFAIDGSIISGPQPRPLDQYEHKIEDGTIMIHILES
jgi:menaquinol-cytochrome c reductase iron-sulfur subunit